MGVQDDPIRVREETSPSIDPGESISDGDVEAFAYAGDLPESVVSLDVAVQWMKKSRWWRCSGVWKEERTTKPRNPSPLHSGAARS